MKKKYEVLGVVGEGAYGIVYKCKNKETGKYVAIKKFKETEDELVQKTMKRELKMLQQLKHENIVEFQESFTYKGNLFLVFEYCEKNLLEVLEESPEGLSPKLIKSFIYQMCKAIAYMHKNNMIHRDIKPENLLIDDKLNLKLCDFGFARKVKLNKNNNNINEMTDYVATRWYRSPELLLSGGIYGPDVDYWAVGCIMGELADGNPMFPGENETDQINCIIKVLGNLPEDLVNMFYKNPIYEGKELLHVSKPESLERRYMGKLGPTAIDFLKGLLQLDPKKRLNTETVFKHKYFACFMKDEQKEKINTNNNTINTINNDKIANKDNNNNVNKISESKESIKVNVGSKNEKINSIIKGNTIENKSTNNLLENNNKINNPQPKQTTETKVINNTTNINIINYNTINNPTNNFIEIHHNNIGDNLNSINNNNNSISNNKNIKDNKIPQNNNILVNNSMIIKVTNNNPKEKLNKIELKNPLQNNMKLESFNSTNYPKNTNKSVSMNNSVYNFPMGHKKSSSMNKFIKLNDIQNMTLLNNYPNLMTISLSQGKATKYNKVSGNNNLNNINNISTTFYSFKNNKNNNNIMTNKIASINTIDKNMNKKNKYMNLLPNNYLGGYKTFFNKNKTNDKYNYDINTNYFKEELKKYNSNPLQNYYNNVIDENDEYTNSSNNGINSKNLYNNKNNNDKYFKKKNYFNDKKEHKLMNKYKDNNFYNKFSMGGTLNKKTINGYGTMYNYGYGKKKNNVELPQLIQVYNKNGLVKNNINYHDFPYSKKY
jgi:cyclin-dependent kinase-like